MLNHIYRNRWLIGLRGVLAILFGIMAFLWPGLTTLVLVFMFGIYVAVDGIVDIITAFRHREEDDSWWLGLLEGVLGIAAAAIAFIWPLQTAVVLLYVIAAWAIITGIIEIVAAIRLRQEIKGEWALALSGAVSIILGIIIFLNPGAGLIGVSWAIGLYAIIFGILMIYLAVTASRYAQRRSGAARVY